MRERKFTFQDIILFQLQKKSGSYQTEIDLYFNSLSVTYDCFPTSSAYTQARQKLSENAYIELNKSACDQFYQTNKFKKWKGYRVLGIDGSTLGLPNHDEVKAEFGVLGFGPKADRMHSLARISYMYDIFNGLVIDSRIAGFKTSESELAQLHIPFIKKNDIVLFDRYYASYPLMFTLHEQGAKFCFRMKDDWWKVVEQFSREKKKEKVMFITLPKKYQHPDFPNKLKCRFIKKKDANGKIQVFCTNIFEGSASAIYNLYKCRWSIEEAYKLIKSRLEVEEFSGLKPIAIKQDFYSKTLLLTLNAILISEINHKPQKVNNRIQKINVTAGLARLKELLRKIKVYFDFDILIEEYIQLMKNRFSYSRKGQNRTRSPRPNCFYRMNYKSV